MARRQWPTVALGVAVGVVAGAVAALNIAIWFGTDRGYEASVAELFDHNPVVAILYVACLIVGPGLGAYVAHRYWN